MQIDSKILIVGANGAMGGFTLLKLYGNKKLSVLILPSEIENFISDKLMQEDQWYPSENTFIHKKNFILGKEPSQDNEIGVFTSETLPKTFFKESNGVVFITSKIFHYESVVEAIKPALHDNTLLVNIVNGLKPEKTLENICRNKGLMNPIIRAVVMGGTHFTFDDNAQCLHIHSGIANFIIGNWDKSYSPEFRDQLNFIACLFPKNKFEAIPQYGNEFRTLSLDKVLANLVNPISAITGCPTIEYVTHPLLKKIITECFVQGIHVGLKLGLELTDEADIIKRKLEMYKKAGKEEKAHLPSMGQDSFRAMLNRTRLVHENDYIGVAIVKEGLEAADEEYNAKLIADFNRLLNQITDHYNHLFIQNKDKAARFLLELMMKNRYSLGLETNNKSLYNQFNGLKELESEINPNFSDVDRIKSLNEAPEVFEKNLLNLSS